MLKMSQTGLSEAAQTEFAQLAMVCETVGNQQFKISTDYALVNDMLAFCQGRNSNDIFSKRMASLRKVLSQSDQVILLDANITSIDGKHYFGEEPVDTKHFSFRLSR